MKPISSIICLLIALVASALIGSLEGASRQPNIRDHLHCKMEFLEQWEEVMQTADPYSVVEAYFDLHGTPCVTPCRLRSPNNPALTVELGAKNSPQYEICGQGNKFCFNGECVSKRMAV